MIHPLLEGLILQIIIKRASRLLLVLAAVHVSLAHGQEAVRRMTLDEAVNLFSQNNLELQLARATTSAVAGVARQQKAYPNPVVSVTHESISDQGLNYTETYYMLTQTVDWPWRHGDRREVGSRRADAAAATLQADSAQLLFGLKQAYVETAAAEVVWTILSEVAEVFRQADRSGSARLEEGDISRFEFNRIRVERARYEQLWMEMELDLARFRQQLGALTMPDQISALVAPNMQLAGSPPELGAERLLDRALANRGEITAALASTGAARANASLAGWARLPDPALTGGYKRQSDGFDGLFVGLAIPLPWWDRKGGEVAAAEAGVDAAEAREQLTLVGVATDVTTTTQTFLSFQTRAALIGGELLSDVDDLLDVALLSYEEGELTLLALLDAAQAYSEAGIAKAQLDAAHWIAYYDLERAVGGFTPVDGRRLENR